jgi:hypothetical protein
MIEKRIDPRELTVGLRFNGDWRDPQWFVNLLPAVQVVYTPALHGAVRQRCLDVDEVTRLARRLKFGARAYVEVCRFAGRVPMPTRVWKAAWTYAKAEELASLRRRGDTTGLTNREQRTISRLVREQIR